MDEDLYEQYAGLFDQQVNLAEEAVVGVVRAAFGDFSSDFKRNLRSLVLPLRRPPGNSANPSSNQQQLARAEEIDTARDSPQRQIATALANGFGALANFPSAPDFFANRPTISGSSTQAVGAIAANNNDGNSDNDSMSIKSEDTSECESDCESHSDDETEIKEEAIEEDAIEMAATACTSNVNSNNDNVSVKSEIKSECESSDSESSDEEDELTAGREIKDEIDDANLNVQVMGNSVDEIDQMQMMEEEDENETQSNDNTNTYDYNFETAQSPLVNSNETNIEQPSDALMIDDDEANNDEGDDEPTIIVVNYEEFEMQTIGSPSDQSTVAGGSSNEKSMNIAEVDRDFVENAVLNENDNEQSSEAVMSGTRSGQVQTGLSILSNTASPLTRHLARASAKKGNYSAANENSLTGQQGTLQAGTRKNKRKVGRSAKSNAPKRSRIGPALAVTASEVDDESEEEQEDDPESEAILFRVIARRLNCRVPGCKKVFPGKAQLDGHLLAKHAIQKYACKVKDCPESYATTDELTTHRNSAHDNLDSDWPCGQCEVTCNNYKDLYHHIYNCHETGLFACSSDKCDFTEKTRIKVHNHQRKHQPAKHRCTYAGCSSSFYMKSHLTAHLRVHSKEKPFLCSQCPKAFALKHHLTRHERVHSGLKPYSCTWPHCDFSASRQSTVITHIRGLHFNLPRSKKKQKEKGIIDNRDARLFVKKTTTGN